MNFSNRVKRKKVDDPVRQTKMIYHKIDIKFFKKYQFTVP